MTRDASGERRRPALDDPARAFGAGGHLNGLAGDRRALQGRVPARGGSRSARDSFVAFRRRPPSIDALLRHNGMVASRPIAT
jgi:oligopeptidase A